MYEKDHVYIETKNTIWWNSIFQNALLDFLKSKKIVDDDADSQSLQYLHKIIDPKYIEFSLKGAEYSNNSRTLISEILFEFVESEKFGDIYHGFVTWLYENVFKADFYFQRIPTIRVHMPGVEGNVLYPCWHSDCFLGHNPRDVNIWFGLTDNAYSGFEVISFEDSLEWFKEFNYNRVDWRNICFKGNDRFSQKGLDKSHAVKDIYNTLFVFDARCIHSATHRRAPDLTTKFSIDIRLLMTEDEEWPIIDKKPVFVGSGILGAEFRVGAPHGYYDKSVVNL